MNRGIVYILENPCLAGWVKIGMSSRNSIDARLAELNRPANLPLSYRAYAIYEVDNPQEVEKYIHSLFDAIDGSLHARETLPGGRIREREFFRISPERAFSVFLIVAHLRGDVDCLSKLTPTKTQLEEKHIAERACARPRFRFDAVDIPVGSELSFLYDESCICTTKDAVSRIEYDGAEYSLSGLAKKLLVEKQGWKEDTAVAGSKFFVYRGRTLDELRLLYESAEAE